MMKRIQDSALISVVGLAFIWGCGSEPAQPAVAGSDAEAVDTVPDLKQPSVDTGAGIDSALAADGEGEDSSSEDGLEPQCEAGEGCFLDPCTENSQCQSGWCVQHMGDGVCSQSCQESCPAGWTCKQVAGSAPDVVYICVSSVAHLCRPCQSSEGCKTAGLAEDVCVSYGDQGSFCGAQCSLDGECPWGFTCKDAKTVDGLPTTQCVADAGECPCTASSVALSLWTECKVENEMGLCAGKRVCTEEGLSGCDAATPAEETCNGVDDDCNGVVDEATCDDENACTTDICNGEGGCEHINLAGGECLDGNSCTVGDHCESGVCVGDPVICDDGDPCTDNVCTALGGCDYPPVFGPCDDGEPCTLGDQCVDGTCQGVSVDCECETNADCAVLEDGNLCNGTLVCNTSGFPYKCEVNPATVVTCELTPALDPICAAAACEPKTGACSAAPAGNGLPCDDGDACTMADVCDGVGCAAGPPVNCNDGNPCTDDSCDVSTGCQHTANSALCQDGDVCTAGDACVDGKCVPGKALNCDDGNICTDDSCDTDAGCVHTANTSVCNDGNACTQGDHCVDGVCISDAGVNCDDANPCTDDSCSLETGCVYTANSALCSDDNACTTGDQCDDGKCQADGNVKCDDDNTCTDDSCNPLVGCIHTGNAGVCNDGNACTGGDQCIAGVCVGSVSVECDDGNVCTKDACDADVGCQYAVLTGTCSDGDPCSVGDSCQNGKCQAGTTMVCDDSNPCTDDACAGGSCQFTPNDAACDDGNACTSGDQCAGGKCTFASIPACDDGNVCTQDSCDAAKGCQNAPVAGGCNDNDPCTVGDVCKAGKCEAGTAMVCDDGNSCTDDSCSADGMCAFKANSASCDDGDACTSGDHCEGALCKVTGIVECDDGEFCTADSCAPDTGCVFTNIPLVCDDGNACTDGDKCSDGTCESGAALKCTDGNVCTNNACNPATGCVYTNNTVGCTDGDACTGNDACANGACKSGPPILCDDGNPCTDDSCDLLSGCKFVNNSAGCNDGNACTQTDTCDAGICKGSNPLICNDGNLCTDDFCNPASGCATANNSASCDDGDSCTSNDVCSGGTCTGGPQGSACCGNGVIDPGEECDDGNTSNGDACSSSCKSTIVAFADWTSAGRNVYVFKSNSNAGLNTYTSFCENRGLKWFVPKSQPDAQKLITDCFNLDSHHTWIITKNTTTAGTLGGYPVAVDGPTCVGYSNSGFSGIRKWACSFCDPEQHGVTKCWDTSHSYDWLACEGG